MRKFFFEMCVIWAFVAFAVSPLFCGGCAPTSQATVQPTATARSITAEIWRTFDADDGSNTRVVSGQSAASVPVRTAPITILGAHTEEEVQAAIEAAELEALCPTPTRATAGDRDVWICEP